LSFGHDEYIYPATRKYLPDQAQYMLGYHSFYPAHRHGAYGHLMHDTDQRMFAWVRTFNPYELYSKGRERSNIPESLPITGIVAEFFPAQIAW
jgi:inositol oxygenase